LKAEELANKALSLGDGEVYDLLTSIYILKGQHDKAVAIGQKGLAINSNSATYNAVFADVLTSVGRYEEALVLIKKAMRLNPNYPSWYLLFLGRIYFNTERYNEAIPVYKKYIELSPSDVRGSLALIACYMDLNRKKEAHESVAEVLRINPNLSLEFVAKLIPPGINQVQREKRETFLEALRNAGLPE